MNEISKRLCGEKFLKLLLVSSVFMLSSCEQAKIHNEPDKKNEAASSIPGLFDLDKVSEKDLKKLWLPQLKAIEDINLNDISDDKLSEITGDCAYFSNSLIHVAKKILKEKQNDSTKELLLQFSTRITNFSRKLRDIKIKRGEKLAADTFWLSVSYNDNQLNVWSLLNSIVFEISDNIEVVECYLIEIATRLNESVDHNIFQNILEEIEYSSPDLINKLYEKVIRLGGQEKISEPNAKKIFNYIETLIEKNKSQKA